MLSPAHPANMKRESHPFPTNGGRDSQEDGLILKMKLIELQQAEIIPFPDHLQTLEIEHADWLLGNDRSGCRNQLTALH